MYWQPSPIELALYSLGFSEEQVRWILGWTAEGGLARLVAVFWGILLTAVLVVICMRLRRPIPCSVRGSGVPPRPAGG